MEYSGLILLTFIILIVVCFVIVYYKTKENLDNVEDDDFNNFIEDDLDYITNFNNTTNNTTKTSGKSNVLGVLNTDPNYAPFNSTNQRKYTKEELMDSSLLLPGQVSDKLKKDFNLPPEAVELDNNNLITVNKSIGVNTVGSSLRNASHDIRGDMMVGKTYQGPWNMSSIEADMNTIGLSNHY